LTAKLNQSDLTDRQLERLYKQIIDFEDFIVKINSRQDFMLSDKLKIRFPKELTQMVEIIFLDTNELISIDNFEKIKDELQSQKSSDLIFSEIKKSKINAIPKEDKKEAFALIKKISNELIDKYKMEIHNKPHELGLSVRKGNLYIEFFYDYMHGEISVSLLDQSWLDSVGQRIRIDRIINRVDFQKWAEKQNWDEQKPYEFNINNSEKTIRYLLSIWTVKDESIFRNGNTDLIKKMWSR
jgi:hypothetical protein